MMDGFRKFRITNLSREISRSIEQKFGVEVSKDQVDFELDCGLPGWYYRYRLNQTEANMAGIQAMRLYVEQNGGFMEKRGPGRPKNDLSNAFRQPAQSPHSTEILF